jgi:PAS domain S-box-containing protein
MAPEQRATVLIVEDDLGLARLVRVRLERAGHAVETATTAEEGMERIHRGGVDLLVIDQHLPTGLSGLQLYDRIKEAGIDVPAILATGFSDEATLLQAIRAGVRDFVAKSPDYLNYLVPAVARVLKEVRTERELVESRARAHEALHRQQELEAEIAERKRAETERNQLVRQLDAEKGRLESILRNMPAGVFLAEAPSGKLTYANEESSRICGRPAGELEDRLQGFRLDGSPLPQAEYPLTRAIFHGEAVHGQELLIERGDGVRRVVSANAAPIRDGEGEVVAGVMAFQDIDDRVRDREALQEADQRKNEFLAMLAHELRNPLAPIRNALEVLRLAEATPDLLRQIRETMQRQVQVMVRLVDDLLDVSRITRGKIELRKEPLDLAPVLARAVEMARPLIDEQRHQLTMELPPDPLRVEGDPVRLAQAIGNLLNNAAKYTAPGGRIWLRAARADGEIVLRLTDTGIGIAPEMLSRVFDLFTQADHPPARAQGGLGIGLTLVRRLVELHGGRVEAHSGGRGLGSEFVVRLPALPDARPAKSDRTERGGGSGPARRILVVDDNIDSAETLTALLRLWGHEVQSAHSGPEALAAARALRPEIVLLDIEMPDMSGYEVAQRLRNESGLQSTVIVAVTGYGQERDRRRSAEAGFRAHLVKPIDPVAFRTFLAELKVG